VTSVKVGDVVG
jgi:D-arabinose 1-dehydrogenase-like Zn-dependent alcohol dehydrogenase